MAKLFVWTLVVSSLVAQAFPPPPPPPPPGWTPPPRDAQAPLKTGTSSITGRVTAGDTGAPIRRALVNLNTPQGRPRATYTDHEGRYTFANLPAGSYNLVATPGTYRAGYQSLPYGSQPSSIGVAMRPANFDLAEGQKLENVDVALPRTGVITGRVTDAFGDPVSRVNVSVLLVRPGSEPAQTGGGQTDDQGQFRIFGLGPGDYIVMAQAMIGNFGQQAEIEGEQTGVAPTYAPGSPSRAEAMRVRVARGGQASADIRLAETRVYSISGSMLTSNGEPGRNTSLMLMRAGEFGTSSMGAAVTPTGTFTFRNVPPGQYEIVARHMPPRPPGSVPQGPDPTQEYASVPVDVSVGDVDNVLVVTKLGAVVTGEIVYDGPPPPGRAGIFAQTTERRMFMGTPMVEVKDNTFTMRNVFGPVVLRGSAGGAAWGLKAVLLRGKDITDEPLAFTASDSGHLQIVFTQQVAAVEGVMLDESGKPALDATVFVFGQDPSSWKPHSSSFRVGRPGKDGKYTVSSLREGRYFAVALPQEVMVSVNQPNTELLEAMAKVATAVTLNPGEKRTLDLVVVKFQQ